MTEFEKFRTYLIGKYLKRVLHSDQGEGIEHLNGLGHAYYFSTVLEVDDNKFIFGNNWIDKFEESLDLIEVTHKNWCLKKKIRFNNYLITDILKDDEGDFYIKLENDIIIYHSIEYGDKLFFEEVDKLFHSTGKLRENNIDSLKPNQVKSKNFLSLLKRIFS